MIESLDGAIAGEHERDERQALHQDLEVRFDAGLKVARLIAVILGDERDDKAGEAHEIVESLIQKRRDQLLDARRAESCQSGAHGQQAQYKGGYA